MTTERAYDIILNEGDHLHRMPRHERATPLSRRDYTRLHPMVRPEATFSYRPLLPATGLHSGGNTRYVPRRRPSIRMFSLIAHGFVRAGALVEARLRPSSGRGVISHVERRQGRQPSASAASTMRAHASASDPASW